MADVSAVLEAWSDEVKRIRDGAAVRAVLERQAAAPVDTGDLRDALDPDECLDYDEPSDYVATATIVVEIPYASFTDTGTRPHEIAARNVSFLRFYWEDGPRGPDVYYFRSVQHPGTTGTNWFLEPLEQSWADGIEAEL